MELEWKKPTQIPDGKHFGKIVRIEYRTEPYEYTDVIVKLSDVDIEMKYGCPTVASMNSRLGRLLQNFGSKFEAGKKVNPEIVLIEKSVEFMTVQRRAKDGNEYSEIVEDSIKPVKDFAGAKVISEYQG